MRVDPTGDLLEVDAYTVVEVSKAAAVRIYSSDLKYRDCDCDPNMGRIGHEDLMVALALDTSNEMVLVANTRAMESCIIIILCFKMIITFEMTFFTIIIIYRAFVLLIGHIVVRLSTL